MKITSNEYDDVLLAQSATRRETMLNASTELSAPVRNTEKTISQSTTRVTLSDLSKQLASLNQSQVTVSGALSGEHKSLAEAAAAQQTETNSSSPVEQMMARLEKRLEELAEELEKAQQEMRVAMNRLSAAKTETQQALAQAQLSAAMHKVISIQGQIMQVNEQINKISEEMM